MIVIKIVEATSEKQDMAPNLVWWFRKAFWDNNKGSYNFALFSKIFHIHDYYITISTHYIQFDPLKTYKPQLNIKIQ